MSNMCRECMSVSMGCIVVKDPLQVEAAAFGRYLYLQSKQQGAGKG